jgi:hypothetical protein
MKMALPQTRLVGLIKDLHEQTRPQARKVDALWISTGSSMQTMLRLSFYQEKSLS